MKFIQPHHGKGPNDHAARVDISDHVTEDFDDHTIREICMTKLLSK